MNHNLVRFTAYGFTKEFLEKYKTSLLDILQPEGTKDLLGAQFRPFNTFKLDEMLKIAKNNNYILMVAFDGGVGYYWERTS